MSSVLSYVISPITYLSSSVTSVASYFWYNTENNQVIKHTAEEIATQKNKLQNIGQVYLTQINVKDEYTPERVIVEKIYEEKVVDLPAASVNVTKNVTISEAEREYIKKHMRKTQFRMSIDDLLARKDTLHHVEEKVEAKVEIKKVENVSSILTRINDRKRMEEMQNTDSSEWSDEE